MKGISDGCEQAGCALVGGETAEMPGMYDVQEYDLAGFAVGAVEKSNIITGETIKPGDCLIGLSSSGLHSNGFSLVRKILLEKAGYSLNDQVEGLETNLGEELLKPTKIYVKPILHAMKNFTLKGMAHITGGGFIENIPRMLPENCGAEIDNGSWPVPPIFDVLQREGRLSQEEMYNIFNMGIGMVIAVDHDDLIPVIQSLESQGEKAFIIGRVKEGTGVTFGGGALT